ncbi:YcnI family copper-binding membrane protein [Paenibacillus radicis (ex Gao et al. 2016)]|uniref:YncI copper-binding domain-containing protein n=1 Tax=Paenibacillus radicis (ex Gao et al. 2016) TaxID=1737354 RepID=A0A917HC83_9BACL|nr:YcnI family protein [Paenibacillus radicis (ex Gao et al. 2016)]GGG74097.1 hypothetical protein GCM10010918_32760 [Paenibacillus radicis (ex Gao et al. 2016)]
MTARLYVIAGASLLLFLLIAGTVSAHVTVLPAETTQGSYEVFTVRVPTEQPSATTKVEVQFPDSVSISRVQPQSGWSYVFGKNADGDNTSIIWTAEGAGLAEGEFGEFKVQGKVADDAAQLVWIAHQTYADGTVVEWSGGEDAETPASVTVVHPGAGEGNHHGAAAASHQPAAEVGAGNSNWLASPALYVSIAALGAGLFSLLLTRRRNKSAAG